MSAIVYISSHHLNIKQCGSVSRPLFDNGHVFQHGLMLVQTTEAGPLLHNARSGGRHLFLDPHFQHLLLLHTLLFHRPCLQSPSQSPIQEAGPPALQSLARPRGCANLGELEDSAAQASDGIDIFQAPGDSCFVAIQKLQT